MQGGLAPDKTKELDALSETSVDMFHDGAIQLIQPKLEGHRAGLDALLLAAAMPHNAHGLVADLGAGTGIAGFAALNLNPNLDLVCVENNPDMISMAHQTLELAGNQNFKERTRIVELDVTSPGKLREAAGLEAGIASHTIMNPPYNSITMRPSPDVVKAAAHVMGAGGLDAWFRTASAITKPGGTLTAIYRTEQIADLVACCQGRFGGLEILPIHSRRNEAAKRLVLRGTRASRAPLSIAPGFVVHEEDGSFTRQADAIFKGLARLSFSG